MDERSKKEAIDAIANCTNCGDEKTLREYVIKHSLENGWTGGVLQALDAVKELSPAQPEQQEISYKDCADATLKMWIDNVLTDWEYNRIMNRLNAYWRERKINGRSDKQTGGD